MGQTDGGQRPHWPNFLKRRRTGTAIRQIGEVNRYLVDKPVSRLFSQAEKTLKKKIIASDPIDFYQSHRIGSISAAQHSAAQHADNGRHSKTVMQSVVSIGQCAAN